jgi:hypothetical protein
VSFGVLWTDLNAAGSAFLESVKAEAGALLKRFAP